MRAVSPWRSCPGLMFLCGLAPKFCISESLFCPGDVKTYSGEAVENRPRKRERGGFPEAEKSSVLE